VTFTSSAAAVPLTFSTAGGGKITQGVAGAAHTFTVGNGGTLTLDGAYEVVSGVGQVGALTLTGDIRLGEQGSVILTGITGTDGAKLTGTGRLIGDGVTIVGGTNGWQAVGTSVVVTIGPDSIVGGAALTAVDGGTPSITVAAGKRLTNDAVINLKGDGAVVGSITLVGAVGNTNGGILAFGSGVTASVITAVTTGTQDPTPTLTGASFGTGLVVVVNTNLESITATAADPATLTVQANTDGVNVVLAGNTAIN
jgi:hypothetical protein